MNIGYLSLYYLMATHAGINMSECRLHREKGSAHFMTKRFDRKGLKGEKLHMQSLCAMAHMDFNMPRIHSYEETFEVVKKLRLSYKDILQLFTRMCFNEYGKNYDDHTKNISFLMDKKGVWSLSPAYDVTFSYKQDSIWVNAHKQSDATRSINRIRESISMWGKFADKAELSKYNIERIKKKLL